MSQPPMGEQGFSILTTRSILKPPGNESTRSVDKSIFHLLIEPESETNKKCLTRGNREERECRNSFCRLFSMFPLSSPAPVFLLPLFHSLPIPLKGYLQYL